MLAESHFVCISWLHPMMSNGKQVVHALEAMIYMCIRTISVNN